MRDVVTLAPHSIHTCKWSPVVLGFKEAETDFEKSLTPRMPPPVHCVLLARLDRFPKEYEPDVVILRGPIDALRPLFARMKPEEIAWEHAEKGGVARSALAILNDPKVDTRFNRTVRSTLGRLQRVPAWKRLTTVLFKSKLVTRWFDRAIRTSMADMSMCRNSLVIPRSTGKANLSFFCTGGIAWGMNRPDHLTAGWPWELFKRIEAHVRWQEA